MRKIPWIAVALLILGIKVPAVYADAMYTYTISGVDSGTITLTVDTSDEIVTAVSGTFDGATIDTLLTPGSIGLNDNSYYDPPTYVFDYAGISFSLDSADSDTYTDVNIGYYGPSSSGTSEYFSNQGYCPAAGCGTSAGHPLIYPDFLTLVTTPPVISPEPGSLILLSAGLLGLIGMGLLKRAVTGT